MKPCRCKQLLLVTLMSASACALWAHEQSPEHATTTPLHKSPLNSLALAPSIAVALTTC